MLCALKRSSHTKYAIQISYFLNQIILIVKYIKWSLDHHMLKKNNNLKVIITNPYKNAKQLALLVAKTTRPGFSLRHINPPPTHPTPQTHPTLQPGLIFHSLAASANRPRPHSAPHPYTKQLFHSRPFDNPHLLQILVIPPYPSTLYHTPLPNPSKLQNRQDTCM